MRRHYYLAPVLSETPPHDLDFPKPFAAPGCPGMDIEVENGTYPPQPGPLVVSATLDRLGPVTPAAEAAALAQLDAEYTYLGVVEFEPDPLPEEAPL